MKCVFVCQDHVVGFHQLCNPEEEETRTRGGCVWERFKLYYSIDLVKMYFYLYNLLSSLVLLVKNR